MESLSVQIGMRLRTARKARGMTQGELCKIVGLDQAFLSRLENGAVEGTPTQIINIARAIGIPIAQVYDEDEPTNVEEALTEEAIEFARAWQSLPPEQRAAMKAAVESLVPKN